MLELLCAIILIGMITVLALTNGKQLNVEHLYYMNDYLLNQSQSILQRRPAYLKDGISLNSMGRVNRARTIKIGNHSLIIHLGNGYITYE